jgi:hypothetical protein
VSLPYELREVGIDWIQVPESYIPVRHKRNTCDAIRVTGIMLPVVIRREGSVYVLVDGIERLKCARELGWQRVPVLVINDERADVLRVALNWVRGRLCGIDLIFATWQLMQSYPIDVVKAVVGRSWETLRHYRHVAEHLMALGLSKRDFEALRESCVPTRRLIACAHWSREAESSCSARCQCRALASSTLAPSWQLLPRSLPETESSESWQSTLKLLARTE